MRFTKRLDPASIRMPSNRQRFVCHSVRMESYTTVRRPRCWVTTASALLNTGSAGMEKSAGALVLLFASVAAVPQDAGHAKVTVRAAEETEKLVEAAPGRAHGRFGAEVIDEPVAGGVVGEAARVAGCAREFG